MTPPTSALALGSGDTHTTDGERTFDGGSHRCNDTHWTTAAAVSPPGPSLVSTPVDGAAQADALLLLYADALDDLERVRIATENRVRALVDVKGMEGTPEQARLEGLCDGLAVMEHNVELELKRALRAHPLGPWVKRTLGVGEKQGARLLAAIGDPAERRTVSQLWAYCGYHVLNPGLDSAGTQHAHVGLDTLDTHRTVGGVAPKRQKGQRANWNGTARSRAWLVATSCIKHTTSPYRPVYDARRVHTAVTHPEWSDGHSHNDGLRIVAKAVLRDLWIEARRVQGQAS